MSEQFQKRLRRVSEFVDDRAKVICALKEDTLGQALCENAPDAPDIRLIIIACKGAYLRGTVPLRDDVEGEAVVMRLQWASESKVNQPHSQILIHNYVPGLQVAVYNASRMQVPQTAEYLIPNVDYILFVEWDFVNNTLQSNRCELKQEVNISEASTSYKKGVSTTMYAAFSEHSDVDDDRPTIWGVDVVKTDHIDAAARSCHRVNILIHESKQGQLSDSPLFCWVRSE